jgi:hypothetical protein
MQEFLLIAVIKTAFAADDPAIASQGQSRA